MLFCERTFQPLYSPCCKFPEACLIFVDRSANSLSCLCLRTYYWGGYFYYDIKPKAKNSCLNCWRNELASFSLPLRGRRQFQHSSMCVLCLRILIPSCFYLGNFGFSYWCHSCDFRVFAWEKRICDYNRSCKQTWCLQHFFLDLSSFLISRIFSSVFSLALR